MKKQFYAMLLIALAGSMCGNLVFADDQSLPDPAMTSSNVNAATVSLTPPAATALPMPEAVASEAAIPAAPTVPSAVYTGDQEAVGVQPQQENAQLQQQQPQPQLQPQMELQPGMAQPQSQLQAQAQSQDAPQSDAQLDSADARYSAIAMQAAQQKANQNNPNAFGNTDTSRAAFTQMLRNLMPLTPNQIVTLRGLFDKTQQAVVTYPGTPPKPTSSSIMVNMSPGATPPIIRLRDGYVTSMVFLDSTGQPWPIIGYDLGNPKAFNIQPSAPDGKSNVLLIQAMDRYEQGNLAVMLKDENTPVMLTLIPGQRAVDYRVDLRVPGFGPNALVLSGGGLPASENPMLLSFLDGTPPEGAKLLKVEGAPAQVWMYQGFLYLRARVSILSPGWIATMSSPDGTHIYQLAKTPLVLASYRGELVKLSIKGL